MCWALLFARGFSAKCICWYDKATAKLRSWADKAHRCSFCYFEKCVFEVLKLLGSLWRKESLNWIFDAYKMVFGSELFTENALWLVLLEIIIISIFFEHCNFMRLVLQVPQYFYKIGVIFLGWDRFEITMLKIKYVDGRRAILYISPLQWFRISVPTLFFWKILLMKKNNKVQFSGNRVD